MMDMYPHIICPAMTVPVAVGLIFSKLKKKFSSTGLQTEPNSYTSLQPILSRSKVEPNQGKSNTARRIF